MVELKDGTLELTRGTVVYVRNENASGHVVNGIHPAVVIQNDRKQIQSDSHRCFSHIKSETIRHEDTCCSSKL